MTAAERRRHAEYQRRYWQTNRERLLPLRREQMSVRRAGIRAKVAAFDAAWGSLHSLECPYPAKGCRCRAIVLVLP